MVDTRGVTEDDGGTLPCNCFLQGLLGMQAVGTECDGSNIRMSVGHAHEAHVLLADLLTCVCKLCNGSDRSGLGSLPTGVGVHFGVEHQDVDVPTRGNDVVNTTVANVIGPAITTDDEDNLVGKIVLQLINLDKHGLLLGIGSSHSLGKGSLDCLLSSVGSIRGLIPQLDGLFDGTLQRIGGTQCKQLIDVDAQLLAVGVHGKAHAQTILSIVLEETVSPCRTLPITLAYSVRSGREGTAVDGGTTGCVGNDHAITTDLGDHLHIGGLTTAGASTGELKERLLELQALD
ncbi:hypothetical protein SDC9_103478 [bioreactor metagenome]|uniref:Uncharacterized protein n=1 Tax=bioreactor metagenome TaxID=1076179 RepID=A0A645AUA6_9ZZZZ